LNVTDTTSRNSCNVGGRISIEVCQGPDCSGLGGGAALLEIEELVQEYKDRNSHQNKCNEGEDQEQKSAIKGMTTAVSDMNLDSGERERQCDTSINTIVGGCRDFCTVGPNVHILEHEQEMKSTLMGRRHKSRRNKKRNMLIESFEYVNDISNCQKAVDTAVSALLQNNVDKSSGIHESETQGEYYGEQNQQQKQQEDFAKSMMARRAERLRWETLKIVSRTIAKCKKILRQGQNDRPRQDLDHQQGHYQSQHEKYLRKVQVWKESCMVELTKAHRAELSATRSSASSCLQERAHRRAKRLRKIMEDKMESCLRSNITDTRLAMMQIQIYSTLTIAILTQYISIFICNPPCIHAYVY